MLLLTASTADVKELTTSNDVRFSVSAHNWYRCWRRTWRAYWSASSNTYYVTGHARINGKKITQPIGRFLLGLESGNPLQCDHINHDACRNTDDDIRTVTRSEQCRNRRRRSDNLTSKYKGVSRDYGSRKPLWRSQIWLNGTNVTIGRYSSPVLAAEAYNAKALIEYGAWASLNAIAA